LVSVHRTGALAFGVRVLGGIALCRVFAAAVRLPLHVLYPTQLMGLGGLAFGVVGLSKSFVWVGGGRGGLEVHRKMYQGKSVVNW
jgi:hypothetical protein